ncbi:M57 family metalloprotease [Myxococcus stipitatus]|uniref:pre-peptidase C-terminal domain-containing protein n=1 Tax=Myxococcus stipitatus TaxID=83455 RepID=UPI001F2C9E1C|nr:M57 family metalloprotease [Myxococcus stipitatus]MCE9673065.1 M57 family metalloprotease [Myxococcus stipitatus]
MSQSKFIGALTGLALLAAGCGGGDGSAPSADVDNLGTGMSWEEFLSGVYQEPESGVFIADGDTMFSNEKKLREFYENHVKNGQLIVHRSGGVDAKWNDTQKKNITYCVSTSFGTNYNAAVTAMANAAAAWEAAANVDFVYVSAQDANCTASNANVVFDVRPVNSGGQYLARAFFPDDIRADRNVLIDNESFGNVSPWTLTGILRHELGHTLGFRHEHTRPQAGSGCYEDSNWRELTAYDSKSVMHYPQCNGTQTGDLVLTALDIQGAQALYGAPGNNPNPPDPEPGTGTPTTETKSGSVSTGSNTSYGPFSVVGGTQFTVTMTGTGDPDLYVNLGAAASTSSYVCRPYLSGASESCDVTVPAGTTTAYIMVRGYSSGTFNLTIKYTKPGTGGTGTPTTDSKSGSLTKGQTVHLTPYNVVAGTQFKVAMTGSGDPDLYVRWGTAPTSSSYTCRPYQTGATETCDLTVPAGTTTAYIMVYGYSAATYNLAINYTKP